MSEKFNPAMNAEEYLSQVDEAKKAMEVAQFWNTQLGDEVVRGDRDSDEAHQRINEADEYARHLESMSQRGNDYDVANEDEGVYRNAASNLSLKELTARAKSAHEAGDDESSLALLDVLHEKLTEKFGNLVLEGKMSQEDAEQAISRQYDAAFLSASDSITDSGLDGMDKVKLTRPVPVDKKINKASAIKDDMSQTHETEPAAAMAEGDDTSAESHETGTSDHADAARAAVASDEKDSLPRAFQMPSGKMPDVQRDATRVTPEAPQPTSDPEGAPIDPADLEAVRAGGGTEGQPAAPAETTATPATTPETDTERETEDEPAEARTRDLSIRALGRFIKRHRGARRAKRVKTIAASQDIAAEASAQGKTVVPLTEKDFNADYTPHDRRKLIAASRERAGVGMKSLLRNWYNRIQESGKALVNDTPEQTTAGDQAEQQTPITNVDGGKVESPADTNKTDVTNPDEASRAA